MCGIVGVMDVTGARPISRDLVSRMNQTQVHRGPDESGLHLEPGLGLGHRRLSIIDLSASAAQPMSNEDGSLWITYNGEIYNHRDLRSELSQSGRHRWKTNHSDTEVILHAFEEWGIDGTYVVCILRIKLAHHGIVSEMRNQDETERDIDRKGGGT